MVDVRRMLQPNQGVTYDWVTGRVLQIPDPSIEGLEITLLSAYATWSGIVAIAPSIQSLREENPSSNIRAIIGSNGDQLTTREALMLLLDLCDDVIMVSLSGDTFHPKAFIRQEPKEAVLVEGSPNLTQPALFTNTEWVSMSTFDLNDQDDVDAWAEVVAMVESSIDPHLPEGSPVGIGDVDNIHGGIWRLKLGGEIDEAIRDSIMPRLQSEDQATRANRRNRRSRGQGGNWRWGASKRTTSGVPPSTISKGQFAWQPGGGSIVPDGLLDADQALNQQNSGVEDVVEDVELLISELRGPVGVRNDERIFDLMNSVLSSLEPNLEAAQNTPSPDVRTVGAWKRLSSSDANHSSEIQSLPNTFRHLTREPLASPGGNFVRIQFLAHNGTIPPCTEARFYFPTSGHQSPRLAHHTAQAFNGAEGGDILVILPLREMNNPTPLTSHLDTLEETDPDCLAIVLPASSEQGARISALLEETNSIQGYLRLPDLVA